MSLREMKEEFKQTEGDPTVKGKIRQMRQARMRKRMMAAVPKASVIITNPTHYAVALQYERGMNAPVCVAKGVDLIALQDPRGGDRARHSDRGEPAARPRAARHRRDRPGNSARALQGGGRGHRLRHAAQAARRGDEAAAGRALADARTGGRLVLCEPLARKRWAKAPRAVCVASSSGRDQVANRSWRNAGLTGDIGRAAVDRSRAGQHGGSIGMVLLVALVLVGAAVGLLLVGRGQRRALYPGAAGRARHGRRVLAVRAGRRHPARRPARTARARCSRRWSTRRSTASWSPTRAAA